MSRRRSRKTRDPAPTGSSLRREKILQYPGTKFGYTRELLPYLPRRKCLIVSPFFGSGSLEFDLADMGYKVRAADSDHLLVNFWHQLRDRPHRVIAAVESRMPFGRRVFEECKRRMRNLYKSNSVGDDPLASAVDYFLVNRISYNGMNRSYSSEKDDTLTRNWPKVKRRLRQFSFPPNLSLEVADFRDFLRRNRHGFVWSDPPYCVEDERMYTHHKGFEHLDLLQSIGKRRFLMTYNDCPQVRAWYRPYRIRKLRPAQGFRTFSRGRSKGKQIIICSLA